MWLRVGELANFFVEREKKVWESRFERPTDLICFNIWVGCVSFLRFDCDQLVRRLIESWPVFSF